MLISLNLSENFNCYAFSNFSRAVAFLHDKWHEKVEVGRRNRFLERRLADERKTKIFIANVSDFSTVSFNSRQ